MSHFMRAKDESGRLRTFTQSDVVHIWWLTPATTNFVFRVFLLPGPVFVVHRYERDIGYYFDDEGNRCWIPDGCCRKNDEWKVIPAAEAIELLLEYEQPPHPGVEHFFDERRLVGQVSTLKPRWDADARRLWFGDQICKQFRGPAPNQEKILAVFQEDDWPERIDDPFPNSAVVDRRQRLSDTVRRLKDTKCVRFEMDGTGEGVRWHRR